MTPDDVGRLPTGERPTAGQAPVLAERLGAGTESASCAGSAWTTKRNAFWRTKRAALPAYRNRNRWSVGNGLTLPLSSRDAHYCPCYASFAVAAT